MEALSGTRQHLVSGDGTLPNCLGQPGWLGVGRASSAPSSCQGGATSFPGEKLEQPVEPLRWERGPEGLCRNSLIELGVSACRRCCSCPPGCPLQGLAGAGRRWRGCGWPRLGFERSALTRSAPESPLQAELLRSPGLPSTTTPTAPALGAPCIPQRVLRGHRGNEGGWKMLHNKGLVEELPLLGLPGGRGRGGLGKGCQCLQGRRLLRSSKERTSRRAGNG